MSNNHITGTIFGVYLFHGVRVFRVKLDNGGEVYINNESEPVIVKNNNELQTIKVLINGELKSPWIQ
jgi:ribosomal protein L15